MTMVAGKIQKKLTSVQGLDQTETWNQILVLAYARIKFISLLLHRNSWGTGSERRMRRVIEEQAQASRGLNLNGEARTRKER